MFRVPRPRSLAVRSSFEIRKLQKSLHKKCFRIRSWIGVIMIVSFAFFDLLDLSQPFSIRKLASWGSPREEYVSSFDQKLLSSPPSHAILNSRNNTVSNSLPPYLRSGALDVSLEDICRTQRPLVDHYMTSLVDWKCQKTLDGYQVRGICSSSLRRAPVLLWSFPGSGNTWVRTLVERATGLGTGSVYNDSTLQNVLLSEGKCNDASICIKAHPTSHPFELITNHAAAFNRQGPPTEFQNFRNSIVNNLGDTFRRWQSFGRMCGTAEDSQMHVPSNPLNFTRAIVVDRHPLDAAFSELQRRYARRSGGAAGPSHTYRFPLDLERRTNKRERKMLCQQFLGLVADYVMSWKSYVQFWQKYGTDSVHVIKYEDLRHSGRREEVLSGILEFLEVPLMMDNIDCVFMAGNDRAINRNVQDRNPHLERSKQALTVLQFMLSPYKGRRLVDWAWAIASPVAQASGYRLIPGVHFENGSRMPNLILGEKDIEKESAISFLEDWHKELQMSRKLNVMLGSRSQRVSELQGKNLSPTDTQLFQCAEEAWSVQSNGRLILLFAGDFGPKNIVRKSSYFVRILNILIWLRRVGVREVVVATFDDVLQSILKTHGISSCSVSIVSEEHEERSSLRGAIFSKRLHVIEVLLRAGIQVVHTDVDAVWTQNPLAVIDEYHYISNEIIGIVASRGTFPRREAKRWGGSTLCMGLISFLPIEPVIQLVRRARAEALIAHGDDQIGINRALAVLNAQWGAGEQEFGRVLLLRKKEILKLKIALLPDWVVRRNCSNTSTKSMIWHCFERAAIEEDSNKYRTRLDRIGLWAVREDWRSLLEVSKGVEGDWINNFNA